MLKFMRCEEQIPGDISFYLKCSNCLLVDYNNKNTFISVLCVSHGKKTAKEGSASRVSKFDPRKFNCLWREAPWRNLLWKILFNISNSYKSLTLLPNALVKNQKTKTCSFCSL